MDKSLDADFKHEKWSSGTAFLRATIGAAPGWEICGDSHLWPAKTMAVRLTSYER